MPVCVDLSLETEDSDSFLQFCSLCSKFLESPSFRCSSLIKESIKPFKLQCLKHMIMVWTWVDSGDFILTQVTHKAIYRNQHFASLCQVHFVKASIWMLHFSQTPICSGFVFQDGEYGPGGTAARESPMGTLQSFYKRSRLDFSSMLSLPHAD